MRKWGEGKSVSGEAPDKHARGICTKSDLPPDTWMCSIYLCGFPRQYLANGRVDGLERVSPSRNELTESRTDTKPVSGAARPSFRFRVRVSPSDGGEGRLFKSRMLPPLLPSPSPNSPPSLSAVAAATVGEWRSMAARRPGNGRAGNGSGGRRGDGGQRGEEERRM